MEYSVTIDGHPPSVNKMYVNHPYKRGVRFKSQELRDWEELVKKTIGNVEFPSVGPMSVEIELWGSWFTQKRTIKKKDCSNYIKAAEDAVFSCLGHDDSYVFDLRIRKCHGTVDKTVFKIYFLDEE